MLLGIHEQYMSRTLELAKGGWGRTNPNPLVGAVIVKDGVIIGEGFHEVLGCAHAEVAAFNNAKSDVTGGSMYVSLEPCSHYGRTPPCAKAIITAGIKEVFVAMTDPNPKVAGNGIRMLREAGIDVTVGVLEDEAKKLNEIFIKYITKRRPFVIMKSAMTLDGKIASSTGHSKWISGEDSRQYVHTIRDRVAAIMVGINTVMKDNPSLTTRLECGGKDGARIVVDSKGDIPMDSRVVNEESCAPLILATTSRIQPQKEKLLIDRGVQIIKADGAGGYVDLPLLMDELYKMELDSILLEGGGTLNASALEAGIVDKVMMFIAPKIIGGASAVTPVEGKGRALMEDAIKLKGIGVMRFGEDIMIEGYVSRGFLMPGGILSFNREP